LQNRLDSNKKGETYIAINALCDLVKETGNQQALAFLMPFLDFNDKLTVERILQVIRLTKYKAAKRKVKELTSSKRWLVRHAAIRALGEVGDKTASRL